MKSEKVLVVGGAGYVGGYLSSLLREHYSQVTVYDNLLFETRFLKNIDFIRGDVRDTNKLNLLLPQYDIVIWLAGLVGDGACAQDSNLTYDINVSTVKFLADNYHGKIFFPSTCSVYGINDNLIDEQAPTNPLSAYASTKLEAEQYLLTKQKNVLIYRLGTLFGISDEHARLRLDLVVNILTKKACMGEKLTVFGGEQWRPLLDVKDVGNAVLFGLLNNLSGLYNLSAANYTIKEIAETIHNTIGSAGINYADMAFEDLRNYKVKNDKILATGWKPKIMLTDSIKDMAKVFSENRIKDINDAVYSNAAYIKKINDAGGEI